MSVPGDDLCFIEKIRCFHEGRLGIMLNRSDLSFWGSQNFFEYVLNS